METASLTLRHISSWQTKRVSLPLQEKLVAAALIYREGQTTEVAR